MTRLDDPTASHPCRAPQAWGPRPGSEDAILEALSAQLVLSAQQMNVPRTIIDALLFVPPDRVALLSASALATYGMKRLDAVALSERPDGIRSSGNGSHA